VGFSAEMTITVDAEIDGIEQINPDRRKWALTP
jgi:hypothetical protein